jgi:hypothetical protein
LAECEAHGIRLALGDSGGLEIDAPQETLTPDLLARLKAHKADLLAMLRPAPESAPARPAVLGEAPAKPTKPVCRCGGTTWRDVPIQGWQSIRRDCGRCGFFLDFPVWYGQRIDSYADTC